MLISILPAQNCSLESTVQDSLLFSSRKVSTFLSRDLQSPMCVYVCDLHRLCPTTSRFSATSASTTTHVVAQAGKSSRLNIAKKRKACFFLKLVGSSAQNGQVPNHAAGTAERGRMGEEEAVAEGGGSCLVGSGQHQEPFQPSTILLSSQCSYL